LAQQTFSKKKRWYILAIDILLLALAVCAYHYGSITLEKRTYQLRYRELIELYAAHFELDPYLVAAVVHVESSNQPDAVSKSGAIGLMQVMPQTGEWIAAKLKVNDFDADMLLDPNVNIRFGCWYLRFLNDRFDRDRMLVTAAYNAGHGTVDRWLEDSTVSRDGQLVNIPYPETERYVEKVYRAYEIYQRLYQIPA